jgi:hypothetical protein
LRVPQVAGLLEVACTNMTLAAAIIAALVFAMTILAYWPALQRGINDVGFVGAGLRAERQRRQGI